VTVAAEAEDGVLDTATTGADGSYTFSLPGGASYRIRSESPDGWTQTTVEPAARRVDSEDHLTGVDFGSFDTITVRGVVFWDRDHDLVRDPEEPPESLSVWLDGAGRGHPLDPDIDNRGQRAGEDGTFEFAGVGPGTHRVRLVPMQDIGWTDPPGFRARSGQDVTADVAMATGGCWWCGPPPPPPPPPPPAPSASTSLGTSAVRLGADRRIRLGLRCEATGVGACAARVELHARSRGRRRLVAAADYGALRRGATTNVTLRLTRSGARQVADRRGLSATARISTTDPRGGPPVRTKAELRILPARR
jgi:hypothetical protein